MRTADLPEAHPHRRRKDFIRSEAVKEHTDEGDISNGVHSPNLMEVDQFDSGIMGLCFSLSNLPVNGQHIKPHLFRQIQAIDQLRNIV